VEPGQRPSPPRSCASRKDLKHIGASIHEHARLRFLKGDEAKRYNVLQKLAYLGVALVLLPLMLLTGLAMSPGMDVRRQADGPHHPFHQRDGNRALRRGASRKVLLSGVWNNLRSMITGRYVIEPAEGWS
jgi:hypothetical protein